MSRPTYAHMFRRTTEVGNSSGGNIEDFGDHTTETADNSMNFNLHPLYFKNIDHPGLIPITKKLAGSENFGLWKRSLTIALSAKNKLVSKFSAEPKCVVTFFADKCLFQDQNQVPLEPMEEVDPVEDVIAPERDPTPEPEDPPIDDSDVTLPRIPREGD
ncbi:hypothetical protein AgCh_032012 [Apium graveolens]